jgi:prevent-host-death family protein
MQQGDVWSARHDLIAQVSDPRLRERLAAERASASKDRNFGLVFEDHLPELLPLYKAQPRRGDRVCRRDGSLKDAWTVQRVPLSIGELHTFSQDHKKTILSPTQVWSTAMRYSSQVKPISYLKANAAEVLINLAKQREPMIITQNGEAKAVLQDVASFEETQETLALLKILALGQQDVEAGRLKPAADVVARLRAKRATG